MIAGRHPTNYAPALAPINVYLAATIKFEKREFPSLPWNPRVKKNQAPDFRGRAASEYV
jgi:hypothetical protein